MAQIATTIEQSKKLIELGIDVNTADMYYSIIDDTDELSEDNSLLYVNREVDWDEVSVYDRACPAWSLSALMELLSYGDILCVGKAAKDDGYLWISPTQSLPNNPLIRDNEVYPSMIDMILDRYIYPYLGQKKVIDIIYGKEETGQQANLPL